MSQDMDRELGWDDEIKEEGPQFTLLPVGEYNFTVEKFERGRHNGSDNLPPCNMALLTLKVDGGEHGMTTITHRLFLHSKTEGFLSNFFTAIGQKKEGEAVRMNWNAVFGAKGRCKLVHNKYKSKGEERVNNQVETFLPYETYLKYNGATQPSGNAGQFNQQQAPQQPVQQQAQQQEPFPTGGQQAQQGGYTPGKF